METDNFKKYEDCYETIDKVVSRFRKKWQLKALNWIDFEDVSQIVKIHIFNKWHMWDQTKPLEPWVSRIASNQIKNLIRNNYSNYVKPCMRCRYNMGENICAFTKSGTQNATCDLYAKWISQKQAGYGIKLPLPMENHTQEIDQHFDSGMHFSPAIDRLNDLMKIHLSEAHYNVYMMLFFQNKTEEDVAIYMGYKTTEKNRKAGYKQIKNLKNMLREKVLKLIEEYDILI